MLYCIFTWLVHFFKKCDTSNINHKEFCLPKNLSVTFAYLKFCALIIGNLICTELFVNWLVNGNDVIFYCKVFLIFEIVRRLVGSIAI